jgi:hypothetical protein
MWLHTVIFWGCYPRYPGFQGKRPQKKDARSLSRSLSTEHIWRRYLEWAVAGN